MRVVERELTTAVLSRPVDGYNLADDATLGSVLRTAGSDKRAVLLVFLRHYG